MINLHDVATDTHPVSDGLYKAIKECPFEKNKDVSNWNDTAILYDIAKKHFFGSVADQAIITEKIITIEDPEVSATSKDVTSYLVIYLTLSVLSGVTSITYKFPIDY